MLFQRNKEKNMELKKKYEIELYKLKKRESRKDKKLASTINTKPESSIPELLQGLDKDKISGVLDLLQGGDEDDYEDDSLGGLGGIIKNNPELVNSFLSGLSKPKKNENNENLINTY